MAGAPAVGAATRGGAVTEGGTVGALGAAGRAEGMAAAHVAGALVPPWVGIAACQVGESACTSVARIVAGVCWASS